MQKYCFNCGDIIDEPYMEDDYNADVCEECAEYIRDSLRREFCSDCIHHCKGDDMCEAFDEEFTERLKG